MKRKQRLKELRKKPRPRKLSKKLKSKRLCKKLRLRLRRGHKNKLKRLKRRPKSFRNIRLKQMHKNNKRSTQRRKKQLGLAKSLKRRMSQWLSKTLSRKRSCKPTFKSPSCKRRSNSWSQNKESLSANSQSRNQTCLRLLSLTRDSRRKLERLDSNSSSVHPDQALSMNAC